jgi:hypothetical protein
MENGVAIEHKLRPRWGDVVEHVVVTEILTSLDAATVVGLPPTSCGCLGG